MTHRRSFSPELKLEAVRAAERSGSVAQTARDLDVKPTLIHRWKRELRDDGPRAFPGNPQRLSRLPAAAPGSRAR